MREYITRVHVDPELNRMEYEDTDEPVIRCRDCKFYQPKEGAMLSCKFEYHGFTQWKLAEPDGFCKWGEKRERESIEVWNQWSADDVTCSEESWSSS